MSNQFKELDDDVLCPCNSGKSYKKCCKKTNFKWGYADGALAKQIHMNREVLDIIEDQKQLFINLYGRRPLENEYLFPFEGISGNEMCLEMVYIMREADISEDKIYAYYKSKGLFPCKENKKNISKMDLQEFSDLCDEYNELISAPLSNNETNILQYVSFANDYLSNIYEQSNEALSMAMNDFIRRHSKIDTFLDYEVSTVVDYCIFSLYKTIKVLKSIKKLYDEHMTESIYALARGLFENYMYINAINQDEDFFATKISPKTDTGNYSFAKNPDGKVNYNRVIHNITGETSSIRVNIADLKKYFICLKDEELYELFYQTACQYVHVDVLSAKNYFYESDPYDEIDPAIIASIISITLAALLLNQVSRVHCTSKQFTKDITFLFNKIKPELLTSFEIAYGDPEHKNEVFNVFIERLKEEV